MLYSYLCIGAGGFIGAILRSLTGVLCSKVPFLAGYPYATLAVNVAGSFTMGLLLSLPFVTSQPNLKGFLTAGLLGGLTTFSTFSFDTLQMLNDHMFIPALLNICLNVSIALFACYLGTLAAKAI